MCVGHVDKMTDIKVANPEKGERITCPICRSFFGEGGPHDPIDDEVDP